MTNISDILHILPNLSVEELDSLCLRIHAIKQLANKTDSNKSDDSDAKLVLSIIVEVLSNLGIEYTNAAVLQKSQQYASFKDKVPDVLRYMQNAAKTKTELHALLRLSINLLYDDLLLMDLSISSRTLMSHIHRVPAVMNKNFPGYSASGLLGMIIRR